MILLEHIEEYYESIHDMDTSSDDELWFRETKEHKTEVMEQGNY